VENALKESFDVLNFETSQLYGSGQFGKLDNIIIEEANILIATPEKSKVILRANETISECIKLVIIDEGHLLDESQRNVKNELFVEELKIHIKKNNGTIILLSAVLPNSEDLAKWITDDSKYTVSETERLARQRLGILEFSRNSVSLEWLGEERSFNTNFIRSIPPKRKKGRIYPNDKAHAVGMTALRLSEQGKSVLIFTSRARSVGTYAKAILKSLELLYNDVEDHNWTDKDAWEELKLLCYEYSFDKNIELLAFAKKGILCHYGNIHKDIKSVLERLMKNGNPRIIVATMTLGQGVNLGVSTVILADTDYYDADEKIWKPITSNEVWNIIGRAGRAFQDVEGKVLFAIQDKIDRKIAMNYISTPPKNVLSGLLLKIAFIKRISKECKVEFSDLLELIANNDFSKFQKFHFKRTGKYVDDEFYEIFDWIDDSILSLNSLSEQNEESIDNVIRSTLAYMQASATNGITGDEVLDFLKARYKAIEKLVVSSANNAHLLLSSLPLASAIALDGEYDRILQYGNNFLKSPQALSNKIRLLKEIEEVVFTFPSFTFRSNRNIPQDLLDEARILWISGSSLSMGSNIGKIIKICNGYFSFTISWVVGAIANKCKTAGEDELANVFEDLSLSCELGLPNIDAAKIYLAGVKSRIAVMDIYDSRSFKQHNGSEMNIRQTKNWINDYTNKLKSEVTEDITKRWLDFVSSEIKRNQKYKHPKFSDFILPGHPDLITNRLYVKTIDHKTFYLSSPDYTESFPINSSKQWPFANFANSMNYYFEYTDDSWKLVKQA